MVSPGPVGRKRKGLIPKDKRLQRHASLVLGFAALPDAEISAEAFGKPPKDEFPR